MPFLGVKALTAFSSVKADAKMAHSGAACPEPHQKYTTYFTVLGLKRLVSFVHIDDFILLLSREMIKNICYKLLVMFCKLF